MNSLNVQLRNCGIMLNSVKSLRVAEPKIWFGAKTITFAASQKPHCDYLNQSKVLYMNINMKYKSVLGNSKSVQGNTESIQLMN